MGRQAEWNSFGLKSATDPCLPGEIWTEDGARMYCPYRGSQLILTENGELPDEITSSINFHSGHSLGF